MSQRPSLLDDADFSSIGSGKKAGGGGGGDKSKLIKIGVLIGVLALAALVWSQPWNWGGSDVVRDKKGNPIVHTETEEDRIEFERQKRQMELEVEQGRATIGGA